MKEKLIMVLCIIVLSLLRIIISLVSILFSPILLLGCFFFKDETFLRIMDKQYKTLMNK